MSYSPTLGRFLECDPIGYDDGINPYEFAHGNPVGMVDPMGTSATLTTVEMNGDNKTKDKIIADDFAKDTAEFKKAAETTKKNVAAALKFLNNMSDDDWKKGQDGQRIKWNGSEFKGTREEMIARVTRESLTFKKQVNGTLNDAIAEVKADMKGAADYDQFVVFFHSASEFQPHDPNALFPEGSYGQDTTIKQIQELGNNVDIITCSNPAYQGAFLKAFIYPFSSITGDCRFAAFSAKIRAVDSKDPKQEFPLRPFNPPTTKPTK